MPRDKNLNVILSGKDHGHYKLPDEILKAEAAAQLLDQKRLEASAARQDRTKTVPWIENLLVGDVLAAARDGKPLPDVGAAMLEAKADDERRLNEFRVLSAATETAEANLRDLVNQQADSIIETCLKPAHREVVDAARKQAKNLDGIELEPEVVIAAGEAARNAYAALRELADKYTAIRGAWGAIGRLRHVKSRDTQGRFAEFARPTREAGIWSTQDVPTGPVARLVGVARAEDEQPWVPTLEEQEAAFSAHFEGEKAGATTNA